MFISRKVQKGDVLYVKVEHVDPFYDRLILKDVPKVPINVVSNATKMAPVPKYVPFFIGDQ